MCSTILFHENPKKSMAKLMASWLKAFDLQVLTINPSWIFSPLAAAVSSRSIDCLQLSEATRN